MPELNTATSRKENQPSYAELKAQVEALQAQLNNKIRFSVSEKGAILISGLRRFPIALYVSELNAIVKNMDTLTKWIATNPSNRETGVHLSHNKGE
jgi:hypothetical protein